MDENSHNIKDFESLLKSRATNRPSALYACSEHKNKSLHTFKTNEISAKEVLADVSRQVIALQNADTVNRKRVSNALDSYKRREFLPVDKMPVFTKVPQKIPAKFETQCVTDTQLVHVVENAEIIDNNRGVTQEFDKTFCQKSDNDSDIKSDDSTFESNTMTDTDKDKRKDVTTENKNDHLNDQGSILFEKSERRNVTPPLVVDLYTFEKFEDIAHPIIEEHKDLKLAKNMINSQIIGREIFIPDHFSENVGTNSPVLSKIECITTNISKDDIEKICTCSNKCVDRDVQYSNEPMNEEIILDCGDKKRESSIKTDIKDEILFSSDEEYEYLHKHVQELPLTCALETSFYDRSDVLDKTMYVGFQTASNKSIQINTDSFTKAKSLLNDIDNEGTGKSLSDLVDIFDSGKAVSEMEKSVMLHCDKLDCDTNNLNTYQVEKKRDRELTPPSTNTNDLKERINDTFKNVSLTALERDEEIKDDVVMSQVIQFKSLSRCAKLNNSITSERKMGDDTLNNVSLTALEPNIPDNDNNEDNDVIMSQVIQFKSISRKPNDDNVRTPNVTQESISSCKGIAKRKLEGFKTASNKKIKLSDKALARCKKVFQGIDLEDPEDISCKSNMVDEDFLDDFKSHDFHVSKDGNIVNAEIDPTRKTNLFDSVSDVANVKVYSEVNHSDSKIDQGDKEGQPRIDNADLQINDQIILQEFEYNEMPFEESNNNNDCIGFKTASNQKIAISDDAMSATKHVFKDIMTIETPNDIDNTIKTFENFSDDRDKNEQVFKKPVADFRKVTPKQTKPSKHTWATLNDNNVLQGRKDDCQRFDIQKPPNANEFIGFTTASRKEIIISEQAREKTKYFYKDLDEEVFENVDNKDISNFNIKKKHINNTEDDFNCGIDTQDFLAAELTGIADLYTDTVIVNQKPSCVSFQGFQTASMKPVVISKQALEKSKKLFEDITNKDINMECYSMENKIDEGNIGSDKGTYNSVLVDRDKNNKKFDSLKNETDGITFAELNKEVEGSKTLFHDKLFNHQENEGISRFNDFVIANNTAEKLGALLENSNFATQNNSLTKHNSTLSNGQSENSKEIKTKSALEICTKSDSMAMHTESPRFMGFKTASAKPIIISAEAKEKSKKWLSGFELKDEDMIDTDIDNRQTSSSKSSTFVGFQTASKKKVTISEKALAKSKQILNDFKSKDNFDNGSGDHTENITGTSVNHTETKNDLQEYERSDDYIKDSSSKFIGFQTASNKKIGISKEALARSKQIFQDVAIYDNDTDVLNKESIPHEENASPVFRGFQTASNKKVSISEKALEKSKKLFHDMVDNDLIDTNEEGPVFRGFLTASNKKVDISEKALEKSKEVFEDIKLSQQIEYKHNNLRPAKVSEEVLARTKVIYDAEEKYSPVNGSTPVFKGFQTASKKKVEISEKALAKSKKLFEDINLTQLDKDPKTVIGMHENHFGDLPIAKNKRVKASEQDSAKTNDMLRDIHFENDNSLPKDRASVFKGIQSASNKKVKISEAALAKSKKLFDDISLSQIDKDPKKIVHLHEDNFGGFQTANNKTAKVSEQALEESKHIFNDNNTRKESRSYTQFKERVIKTPEVMANLFSATANNNDSSPVMRTDNLNNNDVIDTQVMDVFQETLNTEDFCKSTPTSKRSGSPILSCPRAKKRKFQTPYSTRASKKVEPIKSFIPPKLAKTYNFEDNYKKNKKYTLKYVAELEKEHNNIDVDPYIAEFNFDTLLNFVFLDKRNDYTDKKLTIEDLKKIFLGSVNKKIVPDGWLDNHIKLIIWKLLSYEIRFPNVMPNICTVKNVLEQLKYRYDRELYHVQRPILRKILEKDEVPSKCMVLCVAGIYVDNISVTSVSPSLQNVELQLTDGWYCVKASLDRMLVRLVASGAIAVGTKLAVCGAELMNCEQGVAPWEDTSSVRLKLHGNSVRRARWLSRLGVRTDVIPCSLGAARPDGGKMAATRVLVTRLYPPLYVEKMDDGSTVTLSERLENIRQMKYETERQAIMEKLYEEVEKEMSDQESQDSEGYSNEKGCLDSGSQIYKCMKQNKDPDEYRSHLTKSQNRLLEDHNARQREKLIERVRQKFQLKLDKNGLKTERNVVPLLKLRVAGLAEKGGKVEITKGYLSIWKPSAAVLELVTEGSWLEIQNIIPTGVRNSEIQLSAGRQTVFNPYKPTNDKFKLYTNTLQRKCYEIKELTQNPAMSTDNNEIDTVGMIFCIEPPTKEFKEQSFQNVYLADANKNIICINFWGGLKKFGFENVLDTGQVVTCLNLQKRAGNTRKSIPQYRVTEFSYFTKTPKSKKASEITNELTNKLSKIKEKFCEDCLHLKSNYSIFKTRDFENVSPYRFENHASKNMVSPLRNCDTNLNLTGLDFESSFNSQDISPQLLLRKKKVNEKIEKIRLNYGEPPPLSSIHIINKSKNASATYKSPLISKERSKMAETPGLQNVASPVTVNRTFVKNVVPVKLNFSSENLEDSDDHFAEDFDASPPLSLDSNVLD